jgi:O-acetyl-ADP-ribose deacetylase
MGLKSLAFPVLGAGSGGFAPKEAKKVMLAAFAKADSEIEVTLVRFKSSRR